MSELIQTIMIITTCILEHLNVECRDVMPMTVGCLPDSLSVVIMVCPKRQDKCNDKSHITVFA